MPGAGARRRRRRGPDPTGPTPDSSHSCARLLVHRAGNSQRLPQAGHRRGRDRAVGGGGLAHQVQAQRGRPDGTVSGVAGTRRTRVPASLRRASVSVADPYLAVPTSREVRPDRTIASGASSRTPAIFQALPSRHHSTVVRASGDSGQGSRPSPDRAASNALSPVTSDVEVSGLLTMASLATNGEAGVENPSAASRSAALRYREAWKCVRLTTTCSASGSETGVAIRIRSYQAPGTRSAVTVPVVPPRGGSSRQGASRIASRYRFSFSGRFASNNGPQATVRASSAGWSLAGQGPGWRVGATQPQLQIVVVQPDQLIGVVDG